MKTSPVCPVCHKPTIKAEESERYTLYYHSYDKATYTWVGCSEKHKSNSGNPDCEACGEEMAPVNFNEEDCGDRVVDIPREWECQNKTCPRSVGESASGF